MPETRWLNEDELDAWRALIRTVHALPDALDRQLKADSGLPHTQYQILAMLSDREDRTMTMTQLAHALRFSPSRLSHIVAKLEAAGLLRRSKQAGNARVNLATLTEAGQAVLTEAAPGHVEHVRTLIFDQLRPEQVGQLRDIFQAVLSGPQLRECP